MTYEPNDPTRSGPVLSGSVAKVSLSRNEIESLSMKAARGAGLSWGQAEEAGWAAGWLHAHGIDGTGALLAHLQQAAGKTWAEISPLVQAGEWRSPQGERLCPIAVGTGLSDYRDLPEGQFSTGGIAIDPISQPILLVPFLSRIAGRAPHGVIAASAGEQVTVSGSGQVAGQIRHFATLAEAGVRLSSATAPAETDTIHGTLDCSGATLAGLNDLAMRITVPPSEKSRTDAGAATPDND